MRKLRFPCYPKTKGKSHKRSEIWRASCAKITNGWCKSTIVSAQLLIVGDKLQSKVQLIISNSALTIVDLHHPFVILAQMALHTENMCAVRTKDKRDKPIKSYWGVRSIEGQYF